jgi:hypothetical protein
MTCAPSQRDLFASAADDCPPSSSAAHLARMPVAPTPKDVASTASAPGYSSRPSASWAKSDRLGDALRTCLASELEALTGFALKWKRSATPSGRSWWALATPAHRTSETECGSSLLPTCRVSQGGYTRDPGTKTARLSLEGIVLGRMLPTPTTSDGGREPAGVTGRKLVTLLATPTARDWRSGKASETTHSRNSRPLSEQLQKDHAGTVGRAVLLAVCEWLMGYPPGWLAQASPPSATPSCRKSPKRSDAR